MNLLRRLMLTGLVFGCVSLGGLMLSDAPALAVLQYRQVGEISSAAAPSKSLAGPGIAVDGTKVIVSASINEIDAFGATGELEWFVENPKEEFVGDAINDGTGETYVVSASTGHVNIFSATGESVGQINGEGGGKPVPNGLGAPKAIAIDQDTGEVYVSDIDTEAIDVFSVDGEYLFQVTNAGGKHLSRFIDGIAVDDATDSLLVAEAENSGEGVVHVFNATTGAYITTWTGANTPQKAFFGFHLQLAADNATGDVYVAANGLAEVEPPSPTSFDNPITTTTKPAVIDRFSPSGAYESQIRGVAGKTFQGEGALVGVAASQTSGDVYVLYHCLPFSNDSCLENSSSGSVYVFSGNPVGVPHLGLETPSNVKPTSVILNAAVNPEGTGEATCEFEYGTTSSYGQVAPCTAPVANGNAPVAVNADLTGLKSGTTYYYRLDGKNVADGATNFGEFGEAAGRFTTSGPRFVAEGVVGVKGEAASFEATIVPNGAPASVYFQYGTSEAYGESAPAPPGISLGAGTGEVEVTRQAQGLRPDTLYHYHMVVLSELQPGKTEAVYGPDHTFTTQPAGAPFALADGRAWELVTPAEKHGALFFAQNYSHLTGAQVTPLVSEASVRGNAIVDLASAPTETEPQGNGGEVSVFSTRDANGWVSQVINPAHGRATGPTLGKGAEYRFFSEDLSHAIIQPFGPFFPLAPQASESTSYLRSDYLNGNVSEPCQSSCYQPLVTASNTRSGVVFGEEEAGGECPVSLCGPKIVDATPEANHVVLSTSVQLTEAPYESKPEGIPNGRRYYEWAAGELQPLYLLPSEEGGMGVTVGNLMSAAHQLSDNGSVFFTYKEHLYLHDFAKDVSVRLDLARGVAEPTAGGAKFLYASSDGSRVLFSDSKNLTSAGTNGIYECRIVESGGMPSCELLLTPLSGLLFHGSKDASYLYFEGPEERLVVDHYEGGAWKTTLGPYVGDLGESIYALANLAGFGADPGQNHGSPTTEVSPDGRYLTFMSSRELTGYDNHDAVSGRPDVEVYLYDALTNRLACASCNPTGARPAGVEFGKGHELVAGSLGEGAWVAADLPPWTVADTTNSHYEPRFLSDSGRLFFNSSDALVPQDVDGQQDVYEFEPPGVGDCSTASATYSSRSGGCVGLISGGTSAEESAFMDASEGGGDVFFITLAKLTSQDFDNALDVYDAHECTTASPCPPAVATEPPPCSSGDGCKPAPAPQPSIFGEPASATFVGSGNAPAVAPPVSGKASPRRLSKAQKLARALKACTKKHGKRQVVCRREAHRRYGKVGASRKASVQRRKRG